MKLPGPRGALSGALIDVLSGEATALPAGRAPDDDEDLQMALFVCYELAYRAAHDLCGSFAAAEPELAGDVVWGARCTLAMDARWARGLLTAWQEGRPSPRVATM